MPFLCDSADFDGTNDNMSAVGHLCADGKAGTFSGWVRFDGGDGAARVILASRNAQTTPVGLQVSKNPSNKLVVLCQNSAASSILNMVTTPTYTAAATWIHILASWDLAATVAHIYVNDAAPALDTNTVTDDTIEYTRGTFGVGGTTDGGQRLNGCLAEIFFNNSYIDLSVEANRRKFIKANGKPADLGADGSTPLGVQPVLYLHLDDGEAASDFGTNLGSGLDLTITGTLDTGSTSPTDGQEPVADFSGVPTSGSAPLDVQFTDLTTNEPTSWSWDFGDSGTSTDQNPLHTYSAAGTYNVTLTATSNAGTDDETKNAYITVNAVAPTDTPRGNAGAIFASWENGRTRRTEEDVARERERWGITEPVAKAIEEVAASLPSEVDEQAVKDALRSELKLRRISYRTKYLEALNARLAEELQRAAIQRQELQRRNATLLMLIASAA